MSERKREKERNEEKKRRALPKIKTPKKTPGPS
jgi:hypothetical protein